MAAVYGGSSDAGGAVRTGNASFGSVVVPNTIQDSFEVLCVSVSVCVAGVGGGAPAARTAS
eukprot:3281595-Rhodomonas_salina.1